MRASIMNIPKFLITKMKRWTFAFSSSHTENTLSHDNVTHRLNLLLHPNIFQLPY